MSTSRFTVLFTDYFYNWLNAQPLAIQEDVYAALNNLEQFGHLLSRPYADTLKGSKFAKMKELRIQSGGKPIRAFFAFDPLRQAIVLCAGDKSGDKRFYEKMIAIADREFAAYLANLEYSK